MRHGTRTIASWGAEALCNPPRIIVHPGRVHPNSFFFFLMTRRPPRPPLFPYTPLSRSGLAAGTSGARTFFASRRRRVFRGRLIRKSEAAPLPPMIVPPALRGRIELDEGDDVLDLRSEEHTSELQSQSNLVCRLLLEKKK